MLCRHPQLELCLDTETWTLKDLVDRVFKRRLGINEPTVGMGATTLFEEGDDADERLEVNLGKLLKVTSVLVRFRRRISTAGFSRVYETCWEVVETS